MTTIEEKITDAQQILKDIGLPEAQQNKLCALTLLALANIMPSSSWKKATANTVTISKDIMTFVNNYYDAGYKPNSRESFRKIALKPFVEYNIVELNPKSPNLSHTSSKTHYALSNVALKTIKSYGSPFWETSIADFKANQFPENKPSDILLKKIVIRNYKSISEDAIELGRINVFIGANGCGKTNILEAIAMAGASIADDINFEGLYSRGVRIARPNLTISSFLGTSQKETIDFVFTFKCGDTEEIFENSLFPENIHDVYTKWLDKNSAKLQEDKIPDLLQKYLNEILSDKEDLKGNEIIAELNKKLVKSNVRLSKVNYPALLTDFAIFDLNTRSLRGVIPVDSRKTPLGINGEGLDLLISNFNAYEKTFLNSCNDFFDWLDEIYSDKDDRAKSTGLKPGRSSSTLYFTDIFMQKQNNTFSAENSNEGILHVLFYLSLFISNKTPNLFGIDNIETALNPRLCQGLIAELFRLAKQRGKQALITTHNPAVLDGLNLFDDDQRLFEVYRDSEGKTKTRRIKFKSDLSNKEFKISEMWLKGLLGGVPKKF